MTAVAAVDTSGPGLWDEFGTVRFPHVECPKCHEADEVGSHFDSAWCCAPGCGWRGSLAGMRRHAERRRARFLRQSPPLVGTLGRSEVEVAAATVLYGLHRLGRDWSESISLAELSRVMIDDVRSGEQPISAWGRNPFLRPDYLALVQLGFASRTGSPTGEDVLTLTRAGLERVAAHLEETGS